jgi:prevent-host-death family protein
MATKTISAWEARRNFGKLMDEVAQTNRTVIVESHGEAKVAVVPLGVVERIERQRQEFFDTMRSISGRVNLSEEEAAQLAEEAVAWARSRKTTNYGDR